MPALVKQTLVVNVDGKDVTITDDNKIVSQKQDVFVVCDSPRHTARFGSNDPIVWNEQEAQKDISSLPDGFFRLIKIQPNPLDQNQALVFCGAGCARDYLTYAYQSPKTPKELLAAQKESLQVEAAAQAAIDAQNPQMKLPFPEPESDATGCAGKTNVEY